MTVATTPDYVGEIDISSEIRLLKTALMYADKVTFVSLASSMLIQTLQAISTITNDELFATAIEHFGGDHRYAHAIYLRLRKKRRKSKEELIALRRAQEVITRAKKQMYEQIEKMAVDAGLEQLVQPYEEGILDFNAIDMSSGDFKDDIVWQYFGTVCEAILSGETYPIFDRLTSNLVDSAIEMGTLQPTNLAVSQAKQVALSSDLLQRLPQFDCASIDEVLDIRKELDDPLVRFRSAIVKFSRDIKTEAWNREFPYEANQVFIEHVAPAILEIEEVCRSTSFLAEFIPTLAEKPAFPAVSSTLGILLASTEILPTVVSTGLGFAGGAAINSLRAYQAYMEKMRTAETNNLYFYYRAGEDLKEL